MGGKLRERRFLSGALRLGVDTYWVEYTTTLWFSRGFVVFIFRPYTVRLARGVVPTDGSHVSPDVIYAEKWWVCMPHSTEIHPECKFLSNSKLVVVRVALSSLRKVSLLPSHQPPLPDIFSDILH